MSRGRLGCLLFASACTFDGLDDYAQHDAAAIDSASPDASADVSVVDVATGIDVLSSCVPNPNNFDIPGNGCDDDGNGAIDDTPNCDTLTATASAADLAAAMGLCQAASSGQWGLVSSKLSRGWSTPASPDPHQTSTLGAFGVVPPRQGSAFAMLSTGYAAITDDCPQADRVGSSLISFKGGCKLTGLGSAPPGFPLAAAGCPTQSGAQVQDVVDLTLQIRAPNNALGASFDFDFGSGDWPDWTCSAFSDSFVAVVQSAAVNGGSLTNVSTDGADPITAKSSFISVCSPTPANTGCAGGAVPGTAACAAGSGALLGTGLAYGATSATTCNAGNINAKESSGAMTGWLTTKFRVQPGETLTIHLTIWDTSDQAMDSLVLLDHWTWLATAPTPGTQIAP